MSETSITVIVTGIVTLLTTIVTGVFAYLSKKAATAAEGKAAESEVKIDKLSKDVDGRLSELLKVISVEREQAGHIKGVKEEQERVRAQLLAKADAVAAITAAAIDAEPTPVTIVADEPVPVKLHKDTKA